MTSTHEYTWSMGNGTEPMYGFKNHLQCCVIIGVLSILSTPQSFISPAVSKAQYYLSCALHWLPISCCLTAALVQFSVHHSPDFISKGRTRDILKRCTSAGLHVIRRLPKNCPLLILYIRRVNNRYKIPVLLGCLSSPCWVITGWTPGKVCNFCF